MVDLSRTALMSEIGGAGLKRSSGYVQEEFLRELSGAAGMRRYREMRDNDPCVGAMLYLITRLLQRLTWEIHPLDETSSDDQIAAEFITESFERMNLPWSDIFAEAAQQFVFGWALAELVYARDGKGIIWDTWAFRAQESLSEWVFDPETDRAMAMVQRLWTDHNPRTIPLAKCIHFRMSKGKENPEGQALDPETPIPTPDGWRTMDDLHVGDRVFDEQGKIRYVVARRDWEDRPCFEVLFNTGTSIVADANHQWLARSFRQRNKGLEAALYSTAEMAIDARYSHAGATIANYGIEWAGPLEYQRQELLLPPWYLGYWLGNGTSKNSSLTCHAQDAVWIAEHLGKLGLATRIEDNGPDGCLGRLIKVQSAALWDRKGPAGLLTAMGLRSNKHIPMAYLRGDVKQRKDLLAGLMDSDGTVDADGRCAFTNVNMALIHGCAELVRSLGWQASIRRIKLASETRQEAWLVAFTPDDVVFCLPRKIERIKPIRARKHHYIKSIVPVDNRRTVCIEVDSPSHLYLAGIDCVPTHNSGLRNAYRPWYYSTRLQEIESIGAERDLVGVPVAHIPLRFMSADATAADKAFYERIKTLVRNIRRDQHEGLVLPSDLYPDTNQPMVSFSLLSTGGTRQFDLNTVITRYEQRILMTALADFIMLGHEKVGSFALSSDKTDMFIVALSGMVGQMAKDIESQAFDRLLALNGMSGRCKLTHSDFEKPNLIEIADFVAKLTGVGALTPGELDLENTLRALADLPPIDEQMHSKLQEDSTSDEPTDRNNRQPPNE